MSTVRFKSLHSRIPEVHDILNFLEHVCIPVYSTTSRRSCSSSAYDCCGYASYRLYNKLCEIFTVHFESVYVCLQLVATSMHLVLSQALVVLILLVGLSTITLNSELELTATNPVSSVGIQRYAKLEAKLDAIMAGNLPAVLKWNPRYTAR